MKNYQLTDEQNARLAKLVARTEVRRERARESCKDLTIPTATPEELLDMMLDEAEEFDRRTMRAAYSFTPAYTKKVSRRSKAR